MSQTNDFCDNLWRKLKFKEKENYFSPIKSLTFKVIKNFLISLTPHVSAAQVSIKGPPWGCLSLSWTFSVNVILFSYVLDIAFSFLSDPFIPYQYLIIF